MTVTVDEVAASGGLRRSTGNGKGEMSLSDPTETERGQTRIREKPPFLLFEPLYSNFCCRL